MALYLPLARAARAALGGVRARAGPAPAGSGPACPTAPAPPCPPCRAAPPPACRARPPAAPLARRLVCCAPPAGRRPPCAPRRPASPVTCRDSLTKNRKSSSQTHHRDRFRNISSDCECDQDPVAQRLKLAKLAQRASYEREVASRAARPPAPAPPAAYRLAGERECARATDGCTYAVLPAPAAPAGPRTCGPGRTPPPPRCVQLAPEDGCRIKSDAHLDPCAHQPRVMIEIDRSSNPVIKSAPASPQSPTYRPPSTHTGHPSWCANPPSPAATPPRCRRPTIVERLRARPPESQHKRRIHTSARVSVAGKSGISVSGGLEGMLHLKQHLREAGLGRVVTDMEAVSATQVTPPGGDLELSVPPGTQRVAVRVSLHAAPARRPRSAGAATPAVASPTPACAKRTSSSCTKFAATPENRESWLSIKNIQKKLTGRCDQGSGQKAGTGSFGAGCPDSSRARRTRPCGSPSKASSCKLPQPARCGASKNDSKVTKQCSSTTTLLANTLVVNSEPIQP